MAENKQKLQSPHSLILENRHCLSLTGVSEVGSFDEETVVIYTDYGELNIRGKSLHINKLSLDLGEVTVEGEIISMIYTENRPSGGFMSRLFR
ncbi:MAG TPA: sporulation protein YabP [Clostridiales bacterium]|nr:sporulation protein YabP [Clostridiales bacterium]